MIIERSIIQNKSALFFGGGAVKAWLPTHNFQIRAEGSRGFQLGTPPFTEYLNALCGFNTWEELTGGIENISIYTKKLQKDLLDQMKNLNHANKTPVFHIYNRSMTSGPFIAFNVLKKCGKFYRPGDIFRFLQSENIIIRSGCFCNLGSCLESLKMSPGDVKSNFLSGHSCGDEIDLDSSGRPQAALRLSVGYHSSSEDIQKFMSIFTDFITINYDMNENIITAENSIIKLGYER